MKTILTLNVTIIDHDIFSLHVTKFSETALERLDSRTRIVLIARRCDKTDARDFRRLLRLGGHAKHKEHGAKSKTNDCFAAH